MIKIPMSYIYNYIHIYLILIILAQAQAQPVEPKHGEDHGHLHHNLNQREIMTATTSTSTTIPKPYDTLSYNFANATCTSFYQTWLTNKTITDCHAVSLLLENSNAFFHTLNSATATSSILDKTCSADLTKCTTIMTNLASELRDPSNCGADYDAGNAVVKSTYRDLVAYEPVYRATCLTNPASGDYCFVDAVSNTTAPDDYNVYFVPLGTALESGAKPSCGKCLAATMRLYARWAAVDGQPLDGSYLASAEVVNANCGVGFASTNVTLGREVSGAGRVSGFKVQMGVLSLLAALWLT
jgi:hypothetical protein